jgi:hypothetical protein
LRRNHYPPYYSIPGIHEQESDEEKDLDLRVVVLGLRGDVSAEKPIPPSSSQPQGEAQLGTTETEIRRPGDVAEGTEASEQARGPSSEVRLRSVDVPEQDVYSDDENDSGRVSPGIPNMNPFSDSP